MDEQYDVIIVGARCAGAPLATLLAREGLRVALAERATFPKDTLSTHIFQAPAVNFLRRLGVLDEVLASRVPPVGRIDIRTEDERYIEPIPARPGDLCGSMSVRRTTLDPILAAAAATAGADVLMGAAVTGLIRADGRVAGVEILDRGHRRALRAPLVVGADGRNSTVAKLAGARKYNVVPSERVGYWSFFEGADPGPEPAFVFHRWGDRFVLACPADAGLYQVISFDSHSALPEFRADLEGAFLAHARACEPVAQIIEGATRVGKIFGMIRFESFFREASGPGWVLAGDAGCFKDPALGQGIADAFRQAEALAPVIAAGLQGSNADLDRALQRWGAWRDDDLYEHYWLTADFGAAGPFPGVLVEIVSLLQERGQIARMLDIAQHRGLPSKVFGPPLLAAATARLLARPGSDRRPVLAEAAGLIATDARRRKLRRRPDFVPADDHLDAGETEVEPQAVPA